MKNEDIFNLYKKVQQKDKTAEDELVRLHKEKYPKSHFHIYPEDNLRGTEHYRDNLHCMYLHLYR